jgi:hypothetical protein
MQTEHGTGGFRAPCFYFLREEPMDVDYTNLDTWLRTFVDQKEFTAKLESSILAVENPAQRARLMLDLIDYIKPKYKTVDPPEQNENRLISVTYVYDDAGAKKEGE